MELIVPSLGLLLWVILSLLVLAAWFYALVDILRSDFKEKNDKLIWVLIVIVIPILGTILYFIIGRKSRATTF